MGLSGSSSRRRIWTEIVTNSVATKQTNAPPNRERTVSQLLLQGAFPFSGTVKTVPKVNAPAKTATFANEFAILI